MLERFSDGDGRKAWVEELTRGNSKYFGCHSGETQVDLEA